jgi:hypothetical protein
MRSGVIMNDIRKNCKKAVVTYLEVVSHHWSRGTEENNTKPVRKADTAGEILTAIVQNT